MLTEIIIHLFVFWIIGVIAVCIDEDWGVYWAMGLLYPILWILLYPIREWRHYSRYKTEYQKHDITRLQYMFGKRISKVNNKYTRKIIKAKENDYDT